MAGLIKTQSNNVFLLVMNLMVAHPIPSRGNDGTVEGETVGEMSKGTELNTNVGCQYNNSTKSQEKEQDRVYHRG